MTADEPLNLLTHVLLSECALSMGLLDFVEQVGVDDQITLTNVPTLRSYPAGSLVFPSLAKRLVDAGFGDAIVELARPVVAVAFEGDDESDPYVTEDTFAVEAYSLPIVEPVEDDWES